MSRLLANELAEKHRFFEALQVPSIDVFDNLMQIFALWAEHFEAFENGLAIQILRETAKVAGWNQPNWRQVYQHLKP